jgi:hypothetical protein
MTITKATLAALLALASLAPTAADAACAGDDLAGRWRLYMIGIVGGRGIVQECPVTITRDGSIASTECTTVALSSDGLELRRNCRLTGTFILDITGGGQLQCEVSAQMTIDTEAVGGRVQCGAGEPVFMLNMIKR